MKEEPKVGLQSHAESIICASVTVAVPDWSVTSRPTEHLWCMTSNSGAVCHISDCHNSGIKKKCSVCRIVCHQKCIDQLLVECRKTYKEADIGLCQNMTKHTTFASHHWVARRRSRKDNKCVQCNKAIQTPRPFATKDFVAVQCTWCKRYFHNKPSCFTLMQEQETCNRGPFSALIIPPEWIVKLPITNPSIRRVNSLYAPICEGSLCSAADQNNLSRMNEELTHMVSVDQRPSDRPQRMLKSSALATSLHSLCRRSFDDLPFVVKPVTRESLKHRPILVFLNPKSGGNQGCSLLRKFQWLLNPRQVFDLSEGGPRLGLELFGKVPNLRVLACGGDGTVGWVFSTIDELSLTPPPPVAILPLGTGNDLARTLHWGAGYNDESITKILQSAVNGEVISLDRWKVECSPLNEIVSNSEDELEDSSRLRPVATNLPLQIFNNYFSLGADAAAALKFHESREANPEKFNSRLKNKIFYAGRGGKELLFRSWRDLSEHIALECDGKDMTPVLRNLKPHCLLFLNIPRYGSGTSPWGNPTGSAGSGFEPIRFDDGLLEVIGLSTGSLALLHVGGHGERICQCRAVSLITKKVVPVQIDGEPCRLAPASIRINFSHKALVVQKLPHTPKRFSQSPSGVRSLAYEETVQLDIYVISRKEYETRASDAPELKRTAIHTQQISVPVASDLASLRQLIRKLNEGAQNKDDPNSDSRSEQATSQLSASFSFLDSISSSKRVSCIERSQEAICHINDICDMEHLFLVDSAMTS